MTDLASIIQQLEQQRAAIDNALEVLRGLPVAASQPAAKRPGKRKKSKRSMSSEGRQRQIEAMRQYWAKKKAGGNKAASKKATKKGG